ncbi:tyrosine-type recombinase/integrase [Bacillus altitudinis]|uniref:tyrosine-type recombinase/integrase n=1 Tax=Bacillus altitudinis TaxID=293387 RepID=UPI001F23E50E|nr:tyrosine-type recombinase/integrase [Bacillus altitudinis]
MAKNKCCERVFQEVCKRANLLVLSPHALRQGHTVHLLEAGVNIKYVSEWLGYSNIKTTADKYLHVTKKIEDQAMEMYLRYVQSLNFVGVLWVLNKNVMPKHL